MRRLSTVVVLVLASVLALPSAALAVGTLDQEQTTVEGQYALGQEAVARPIGQTFTAGLTGDLDTVGLYPKQDSLGWAVEIRTTSGGLPTNTVLASQPISSTASDAWVNTTFATPAAVVAGTQYAIVVVQSAPGFVAFGSTNSGAGTYAGGTAVGTAQDGTTWSTADLDLGFQTYVTLPTSYQPDGWIRKNAGPFVGNNIYNDTGVDQKRVANSRPGARPLFRISIQNEGNVADQFGVAASGDTVSGYKIRYFRGATEITDAVVAGTYQTSTVGPGTRFTIEAFVRVKPWAAEGSSVSRLVTITSVGDPTKEDAVKFVVNRR